MSKQKPITPYERLMTQFEVFVGEAIYPRSRSMWVYPKAQLGDRWRLSDLAERVAAADQLGWDVVLKNTDQGLEVVYQTKRPKRPWNI